MFPVGSEIKNLICVKCDTTPPTFSRREFIRAKNIKRFEQLKKGRLVRCFYESKDEKGIYVTVLTKDFHDKVLITNKNIHNNPGTKLLKYQNQQVILGKILDIDVNKRTLKLTTKVDPSTNVSFYIFHIWIVKNKKLLSTVHFDLVRSMFGRFAFTETVWKTTQLATLRIFSRRTDPVRDRERYRNGLHRQFAERLHRTSTRMSLSRYVFDSLPQK